MAPAIEFPSGSASAVSIMVYRVVYPMVNDILNTLKYKQMKNPYLMGIYFSTGRMMPSNSLHLPPIKTLAQNLKHLQLIIVN